MFAVDEQASEKGGPSTPSGSSLSDEEIVNHLPKDGEKSTPVVYPEGGLRGWSVVLGV